VKVALATTATLLVVSLHGGVGIASTPMRFGANIESIDLAQSRGLPLSYGTFWVGSWTQRHGWGYAQDQLRLAAARNVTPVIHWWYWGDDISPNCVEHGCRDPRQDVFKDKATWFRLSRELAELIERTLGAREAIVVLETEFNKGGIETYEPFDEYLAQQAAIFHGRGHIKVVLGFGNWGREHWPRFDRAIGAADLLGTQLLRSSIRDASSYPSAIDTLVSSARYLRSTFGKDSMVIDLALSSYPSSGYESMQAAVAADLFARLPDLKAAGVRGVLYRMLADDPRFDTSNYHG
jgi:hypothetical protein